MNILITGGTGFIGSHVTNRAIALGHNVTCLRRSPKSNTRVPLIGQPAWLDRSFAYVKDVDALNIDLVLHLAAHSAQPPYDTLERCITHNLVEPLAMFNRLYSRGVSRFVVAGSCFEYGLSARRFDFIPPSAPLEPIGSYPASKAAASVAFLQWAAENNVSLSIKRIFQTYGEGEESSRLFPSLVKAARNGEHFPMSKGEQVRDFIHVAVVADVLIRECESLFRESIGQASVSNLGSGKPKTVLQFAQEVWKQYNHTGEGELVPGAIPYRHREIMRCVPEMGTTHHLIPRGT
jgi:nucleoside-diphosphate-sugar epimerase